MVRFGQKVFLFEQKWLYLGKLVLLGQIGSIWAKVVLFGQKVVVFGQKLLYLGERWLYMVKSGCIVANWFYLGKSGSIFAKRGCICAKVVVFGQNWFYLGKLFLFGQISFLLVNVVIFG